MKMRYVVSILSIIFGGYVALTAGTVNPSEVFPLSGKEEVMKVLPKDQASEIVAKADAGDANMLGLIGECLARQRGDIDLIVKVNMLAYEKGYEGAAWWVAGFYARYTDDAIEALKWWKRALAYLEKPETVTDDKIRKIRLLKSRIDTVERRCKEQQALADLTVANRMKILSDAEVEKMKQESAKFKESTFVFKGLHLGMDALAARRLLRYYVGDITNEVSEANKKVTSYILSRQQIDRMFKTEGVSAEAFCKSLTSAYPIVEGFDLRSEEIADLEARKKFLSRVQDNEMLYSMQASNATDAYEHGVAAGRRAGAIVNTLNKFAQVFFYESARGFLLEIRPDEPNRFFTLKQINSLQKANFD